MKSKSFFDRFSRRAKGAKNPESREFVAEQLESRVLYSAAPVDVPEQASVEEGTGAGENPGDQFGSIDHFEAPLDTESTSTIANESVTLTSLDNLTDDELAELADAAEQRWIASGLSDEQVAALDSIAYSIVDLEADIIGLADGYEIVIDLDAAGEGWFIDTTPFDDSEFTAQKSWTTLRATEGDAVYGIDLLSVLMHEQGHVLGLEDIYESANSDSIMYGYFEEGERRTVTLDQAGDATPLSLEGPQYAVTSAVTTYNLSYTQSDPTTGGGVITADIDISDLGGSGVVTFTGNLPLAYVNQKDDIAANLDGDSGNDVAIPPDAVGFLTETSDAIPGTAHGVHFSWDDTVTLSVVENDVLYTVELDLSAEQLLQASADTMSASVQMFDDNGAGNDVTGKSQISAWFGDDGGGNRHSGTVHTWESGVSTLTTTHNATVNNTNSGGDQVGITISSRTTDDDFVGVIFIDQINVSFALNDRTVSVTSSPLTGFASADAYTVAEDGSLVASDADGSVADVEAGDGSFNGVLANDVGDLTVSAVQGTALSGGTATVNTDRGGSVTLQSDGTFTYSQNGAMDSLAAGTQDTDSFSYTVIRHVDGVKTLAGFDFNTDLAATSVSSGYTVSDVTTGSGLNASSETQSPYTTNVLKVTSTANSTMSLAAAITNGDYFEFTTTPVEGEALDLVSFSLDAAKGGTSDRGFAVMASLDGGVTGFTEDDVLLTVINPPVRSLTSYNVDLSSLSPAADEAITIRVYNLASSGTMEYDNFSLNTTADVVETVSATITVDGVNDAPVATGDTASATEAGGYNNSISGFDPTGNVITDATADSDVDAGDTLSVTKIDSSAVASNTTSADGTEVTGTYGSLKIGADGSWAYTVNQTAVATEALTSSDSPLDVFTYTLSDGSATTTATLSVTVNGADDVENGVFYVDGAWDGFDSDDRIDDADAGASGDQLAFFNGNAFSTISAAIAAAGAGDTIIVNAGTFAETVNLDDGKILEITGPDADQAVSITEFTSEAGTSIVIEGGSTLTINNAVDRTIAGTITGSGNLVKTGAGDLTVTGDNNYSGTTTVSGGALLANGSHVGSPIATSDVIKVAWDQADRDGKGSNIRGSAEIAAQERGTDTQTSNQGVSYLKFDLSGLSPEQVNDPDFSAVFSIDYVGRVNGTQNMEVGMSVVASANTWSDTPGDYPLATWVAPANINAVGSPLSADYILIENVLTTAPTGQAILVDATADVRNWVNGVTANNGYVIYGTYDTFQGADFSDATLFTSAGYTVENGATLGGSGNIGHTVTVESGGNLAPGSNDVGTLTIDNNLILDGNLAVEVNDVTTAGTDFDQLVVNGTLTLGASATLVPTGAPPTTGDLTIIANDRSDAVSGTFNGLDEGDAITIGGQIFEVSYAGDTDSNDIVLRAPQTTAVVDGSGNLVVTDVQTDSADTITISLDSGTSEYVITNSVNGFEARISQASVTGGLIIQSAFGGDESGDANADTVIVDSDLSLAGPITITADTITLNGNLSTTVGDISLDGDVTLSKSISLEATEAAAGDVVISGAVNMASGQLTVDVAGSESEIAGVVSGTSLIKLGGGTLTLSEDNLYTGGTLLNGGFIVVMKDAALGTGTLTTPSSGTGGDLVIGADGLTIANAIFIRNEGPTKAIRFDVDGANSATLTGNIQIHETGPGQFAMDVGADDTLNISGNLFFTAGGGAGLSKNGEGTLVLTGTNVYKGPTEVAAGTLLINGDHSGTTDPVTVASGATLGGTGTLGGIVTIDEGATLAPGSNGVGALTIENNLILNGTLAVEVDGVTTAGTDFDQVVVEGTVTLGANSGLVASGTTTSNGQITILANDDNDSVSGTFSSLSEGGEVIVNGHSFSIGYAGDSDANDIVLGLPETAVEVDTSGNLVVTDFANDSADTITISLDSGTGEYVVTNTFGVFEKRVAQSSVTGGLIVQTAFTGDEGTDLNSDTVVIDGALTFAGPITITADVINLNGGLIATVGDITLTGDVALSTGLTLSANEAAVGDVTINGDVDLGSNSLTLVVAGDDSELSGVISGTGNLTKEGNGTLTVSGTNTYTGVTSLNNGTTRITDSAAFGGSGLVNMAGTTTTTLEIGADGLTVANQFFIRNNGSVKTIRFDEAGVNSATFTGNFTHHEDRPDRFFIDTGAEDTLTLSGNLFVTVASAGDAGITKTGEGTLILSGTNTYNGATNVTAGTLLINGDNSGVSTVVNVASGATLGGVGIIGGSLVTSAGSIVAPGNSGIGNLTINGDATIGGGLEIVAGAGAANVDLLTVAGTLDVSGATLQASGAGLDQAEYILATYTGVDPTAFASKTVPAGYVVEFDATNDQIKLVVPELALSNSSVDENDDGASVGVLTMSDAGSTYTFTVDDVRFEVDGSNNLKLKAGETLDYETEQTVEVEVTATDNDSSATFTKDFTITVTDVAAIFTIVAADADKSEGDSGNSTSFTFTVTRTGDTNGVATVDYAVTSLLADAADFGGSLPVGTETFGNGITEKTLSIDVSGDADLEVDETFTVTLSDTAGDDLIAIGSPGAADGVIRDDDGVAASIIIEDVYLNEGDATATFIARLTESVAGGGFTVEVSTEDLTAEAGPDYSPVSSLVLTFAGTKDEIQTFTVPISSDVEIEGNETFRVTMSNSSNVAVTITDTAIGTIQDNDTTENANLAITIPGSGNGTATLGTAANDGDSSAITLSTASVSQSGDEITFNPGTDFDFLRPGDSATVNVDYTLAPAGSLNVDFGTSESSSIQTGYQVYFATHEVDATFTTQSFTGFGTTIDVTPTWSAEAVRQAKQMFYRSDTVEEEYEDLLRDWIGTDTRNNGEPGDPGPLTITLSGVPAGTYT